MSCHLRASRSARLDRIVRNDEAASSNLALSTQKGPWGSLVSFMLGVHVTPVQIWGGPPYLFIPLKQSPRSLIIVSIHQCWHSFRYACAVFSLNLPLPRLRSLHQDRTVNLFHASPPEWAEGYISASDLPSVLDHLLFFRPSPRDGGYNGTRSFFLQGCPLPVLRMTSSFHCVLR